MRLYLDTNVYAHAQEARQELALKRWLEASGHQVVLSDVLLGEAIAIREPAVREGRLRLLAELPSRKTQTLASLQAIEFVNEMRRARPQWRRLPIGDLAMVNALQRAHGQGWRLLHQDRARLVERTGQYRAVEGQAIRGSRAGQRTMRDDLLSGQTITHELVLNSHHIPVRRLDLNDADDFCRVESLFAWYGALVQQLLTLSDYRNYAEPYVDARRLDPAAFVTFWLDEVDLQRMLRGLATSLVIFAQLRSKIVHGNAADSRHAGHVLDADLLITEDQWFFAALSRVAGRLDRAARPCLIARSESDLVAALGQAVTSPPHRQPDAGS
jgi:hypothetical protein